jgi:hypothetical protein
MKKQLEAYRRHLRKTYADGFPAGTQYQKDECRGLRIEFVGKAPVKVFVTVSEWSKLGRTPRKFLHSLVTPRKKILHPRTKNAKGNLTNQFKQIRWNCVQ